MASAKGLCYALDKPFITISSLEVLTRAAIATAPDWPESTLFCPMIDARRMEVFTALFDSNMNEVLSATAMILENHSFEERLKINKICFFGDGARKFGEIVSNSNAVLLNFWTL
jgi:tRNA threonylcarbamoyladenosine biosynthesis protein TsaB